MKHAKGKLEIHTAATTRSGYDLQTDGGELVAYNLSNKANAARLALCWNLHDELVGVAEWVIEADAAGCLTTDPAGKRCLGAARVALAKVAK